MASYNIHFKSWVYSFCLWTKCISKSLLFTLYSWPKFPDSHPGDQLSLILIRTILFSLILRSTWEWIMFLVYIGTIQSGFLISLELRHCPLPRSAILWVFCCIRYLWKAQPALPCLPACMLGIHKLTSSFNHCTHFCFSYTHTSTKHTWVGTPTPTKASTHTHTLLWGTDWSQVLVVWHGLMDDSSKAVTVTALPAAPWSWHEHRGVELISDTADFFYGPIWEM